jgi:hypothetical protein
MEIKHKNDNMIWLPNLGGHGKVLMVKKDKCLVRILGTRKSIWISISELCDNIEKPVSS